MLTLELDQDGHLVDYQQWSPEAAQQLANNLELQLTDWHFSVLNALRNFYTEYGYAPATRPLIKYLSKMVNPEISNQLLMQKFNTGLVARHLNRLAGLPKPPNCL
ncbi:TusE/DsrC/DsvC family sulfur relay protein [Acinetobacter qingfengensis]|uniref:Sulfurtransferase n=1 Tax=Acinetobacter qingfengensis TaxID=1262585 RepID=A0A1E7RBP7_9GAMM|nr:TusE/DsrC/DsvC family sulfur relay protein [Acinetobacter qingfengensis]KAA8734829.1 TusE/DsrC/DsvC family sulfur relay protein [Acinetobacter qingfengensis]OEY96869.1 sulfite reductase [Acinetobacter qingfengensis]